MQRKRTCEPKEFSYAQHDYQHSPVDSHHVGFEGDWGLDSVEGRRLGVHDSSAWHLNYSLESLE